MQTGKDCVFVDRDDYQTEEAQEKIKEAVTELALKCYRGVNLVYETADEVKNAAISCLERGFSEGTFFLIIFNPSQPISKVHDSKDRLLERVGA